MSESLRTSPSKRSTSLCLDTPSQETRTRFSQQFSHQNSSFDQEQNPSFANENSIYSDFSPIVKSNHLVPPPNPWDPTSRSPSYADVERLSLLAFQLKDENKALAHKLKEMGQLEQKVAQIEAQNKQLLRESTGNKKDASPVGRRSYERNTSGSNSFKPRNSQPSYGEVFNQNKALTGEVTRLKGQIESISKEKKVIENKKERLRELESQLEDANVQIEFLNNELESKDYEVRGLREKVLQLTQQREEGKKEEMLLQGILSRKSSLQGVLESETIKEDLIFLQNLSEQLLKKLSFCEDETRELREKAIEREYEVERLKNQLVICEESRERSEQETEDLGKGIWSEAVNQMLLEKANYRVKIIELEGQVEIGKRENEKIKSDWEEEMRVVKVEREKMEVEITRLRSELGGRKPSEDEYREEKSRELRINPLSYDNMAVERNLMEMQSEVVGYKQRMQELEVEKERLEMVCRELEREKEEREKVIEEYVLREEEREKEVGELRREALDGKELEIKCSGEKKRQEREINHLKASVEEFKEELGKVYGALAERKEEYNNLMKQNEMLRKENCQLKSQQKGEKSVERSPSQGKYTGRSPGKKMTIG